MMPYGVRPGEIIFDVVLIDNFGARTIHTESPNGKLSFVILNEPLQCLQYQSLSSMRNQLTLL